MIFVPLYEGEKGTSFDRYYPSMIVFEMEMRNDDASIRFGNTVFPQAAPPVNSYPSRTYSHVQKRKKEPLHFLSTTALPTFLTSAFLL